MFFVTDPNKSNPQNPFAFLKKKIFCLRIIKLLVVLPFWFMLLRLLKSGEGSLLLADPPAGRNISCFFLFFYSVISHFSHQPEKFPRGAKPVTLQHSNTSHTQQFQTDSSFIVAYNNFFARFVSTSVEFWNMQNLVLASKVLYNREVLSALSEVQQLKKASARHLFYPCIDTDLRMLNARVVRCDCAKCMDMMGNNYPEPVVRSEGNANDVPEEGEADWISYDPEAERYGGSMYGMLVDAVTRRPLVRYTETSRKNCALLEWFRVECERHGLPKPIIGFGCRSYSLWRELGHLNVDLGGWSDTISRLPYKELVVKVYKGLLHQSLGSALLNAGAESSVLDDLDELTEAGFEAWFQVEGVSLLP